MNARTPSGDNAAALRRDARRERLLLLSPGAPALLVVALLLCLPIGWMFWLALVGAAGQVSGENFARLAADESVPDRDEHHLPDRRRGDGRLRRPRLPAELPAVGLAPAARRPADDRGDPAVLDLDSGAHLCVAAAPAAPRSRQQLAHLARGDRRAAAARSQLHRHRDRHGARDAAVPRPAAVRQKHATDRPQLRPRRRQSRRHPGPRVLERVFPAVAARPGGGNVSGHHDGASNAAVGDIGRGINFYEEVRRFEIDLIRRALEQTGGHQSRAARLLGMNATTLNSKIKTYNINLRP